MPSKSKAQQKFMGMVHALQKGELDPKDVSQDVRDASKSMKKKDAKDFASTSHKGLPRKVKQEILNRLKEYANKMGTDHLGGDDYTSSKKGGLRDFDGYDNVDYNKDMPMDESNLQGQLAGDSVQDIIKSIGSRFVSGEIKNTKRDGKTYIKLKDEKFGSGVVKILKSRFGIDAKLDYYGGKGKVASSPSVSFFSDTILEGGIPQNWMSGRTSDYHTKLRGKEREYDDTNFDKENSGQSDLEESFASDLDMIKKDSKNLKDFIKKVLSDNDFRSLKGDRDFVKYLSSMYNESVLSEAPIHAMMAMKASQKAMEKQKVRNPKTGNDVSAFTAFKDKNHPSHKQALSLFQRIKKRLVGEYASNQTLSYIPADEEEVEKMNETMIRRAVDLAQELLPKDTWSRYASDGKKNAEFVKSIVRDLTQLLNKFYKDHKVDVRLKEEVLSEVLAGRIHHYTGSKPGRLVPGSFATVKNDRDREKKRAIEQDLAYHLNSFWKKWNFPYRIDLTKKEVKESYEDYDFVYLGKKEVEPTIKSVFGDSIKDVKDGRQGTTELVFKDRESLKKFANDKYFEKISKILTKKYKKDIVVYSLQIRSKDTEYLQIGYDK